MIKFKSEAEKAHNEINKKLNEVVEDMNGLELTAINASKIYINQKLDERIPTAVDSAVNSKIQQYQDTVDDKLKNQDERIKKLEDDMDSLEESTEQFKENLETKVDKKIKDESELITSKLTTYIDNKIPADINNVLDDYKNSINIKLNQQDIKISNNESTLNEHIAGMEEFKTGLNKTVNDGIDEAKKDAKEEATKLINAYAENWVIKSDLTTFQDNINRQVVDIQQDVADIETSLNNKLNNYKLEVDNKITNGVNQATTNAKKAAEDIIKAYAENFATDAELLVYQNTVNSQINTIDTKVEQFKVETNKDISTFKSEVKLQIAQGVQTATDSAKQEANKLIEEARRDFVNKDDLKSHIQSVNSSIDTIQKEVDDLQDEFGKKYSLKFDCKNCEMYIMQN
jgi:hypothetical protein